MNKINIQNNTENNVSLSQTNAIIKDIEREMRRQSLSIDDKISVVEKELENLQSFKGPKTIKEKDLEDMLSYLKSQKEVANQNKELAKYRQNKALERLESQDLIDYFRYQLMNYFKSQEENVENLYKTAQESNFVLHYLEMARLNFNLPTYQIPIKEYKKALSEVYQIYKEDIKCKEQLEKQKSEELVEYFKRSILKTVNALKNEGTFYEIFKALQCNKSIIGHFEDAIRDGMIEGGYPIKEYQKALNEVKTMYKTDIELSKPKKSQKKDKTLGWLLFGSFMKAIDKIKDI